MFNFFLFFTSVWSRILPFRSSILLFAFDTVPSACFPSSQAPSHPSRLPAENTVLAANNSALWPEGIRRRSSEDRFRAPRASSSTTANPAIPLTNEQQEVLAIPWVERIPKSHVLSQSGYVKVARGENHAKPGRNLRPNCEISVCRVSLEYGCRENVLIITVNLGDVTSALPRNSIFNPHHRRFSSSDRLSRVFRSLQHAFPFCAISAPCFLPFLLPRLSLFFFFFFLWV
jgi:hypothetical protein